MLDTSCTAEPDGTPLEPYPELRDLRLRAGVVLSGLLAGSYQHERVPKGVKFMRLRLAVLTAICALVLGAVPALGAQATPLSVNPATRTVTTSAFTVHWSATDPEEILSLSWRGSPNLTNTVADANCPTGGDLHFFGNSWDTYNDTPNNFVSLVGWGTTGRWFGIGNGLVAIQSADSGCYGTSGVRVTTSYQFPDNQNWFLVERAFSFGATPFTHDFRPYIPRLYPRSAYHQVLHPDSSGRNLVTEESSNCEFGCQVSNWNGTWFAVFDPTTGGGMIVRHMPSRYPVALWVDQDGGSFTTASSVALLQPPGGFTGTVLEMESFCFFANWTPSLNLPPGCPV